MTGTGNLYIPQAELVLNEDVSLSSINSCLPMLFKDDTGVLDVSSCTKEVDHEFPVATTYLERPIASS